MTAILIWVSKLIRDNFGFDLLQAVFDSGNSRHFLNQTRLKHDLVTCVSRAWGSLHVLIWILFALIGYFLFFYDWLLLPHWFWFYNTQMKFASERNRIVRDEILWVGRGGRSNPWWTSIQSRKSTGAHSPSGIIQWRPDYAAAAARIRVSLIPRLFLCFIAVNYVDIAYLDLASASVKDPGRTKWDTSAIWTPSSICPRFSVLLTNNYKDWKVFGIYTCKNVLIEGYNMQPWREEIKTLSQN